VTRSNEAIRSAFARHKAGALDEAEALYAAILRDEPDNLNGLQLLGLLIHQRGRSAAAVDLLQRAIAVIERRGGESAEHASLHNNLGTALRAAGRTREAVAQYRRGLILDPTVGEIHVNLGNALLAGGATAEAIKSFETALKLGPLPAESVRNLA
jgi:protein O-GlcNAc transferase